MHGRECPSVWDYNYFVVCCHPGAEQCIRMATDDKIVVVTDTGTLDHASSAPQCLGLQLLFIQTAFGTQNLQVPG